MTIADYLFGVFVAAPMGAICLAFIAVCYGLPFFLMYCWINR